ncbi:MAG: hypothetical protein NVSMB43_15070 [Pseudarthrobacter sp.]
MPLQFTSIRDRSGMPFMHALRGRLAARNSLDHDAFALLAARLAPRPAPDELQNAFFLADAG